MRPAEFTNEQIIEAGQELQAAGRNITGFALRQKVGGGNPSRLKQIWDEHASKEAVTNAEPVAELPIEVAEQMANVTQALTERLGVLAVELNDKAVKAAERRVAEVIRTAGEQREQAERELADASQTVEDLEAKLDEGKAAADALEKRLSDLQAAHQAQAVELAQVRERLALAEQTAKTAAQGHADALAERDAARAELVKVQAQAEAAERAATAAAKEHTTALTEAKQASQDAAAERDQARAELATVKAKAEAAEQAHQEQRKAAGAEAHRQAERLTAAQAERDEARKEAGSAREDAAKLRGQVETLQTQASDLMRALAARQPAEGEAEATPAQKATTKTTKAKKAE